jgi:hypothetical protein
MILLSAVNAQEAFQFTGEDCNGNAVDLYADLDAGKAAILIFYMPDCGACPPPAAQLQEMANNVMNDFPDMVKGYAFPFLDIYDCASVQSWVDDSHVPFFAPMDSGEYQVAYYGGFGMPTVVLVGGLDHRVLFSTLSYFTSDTTIIRDSIYRLFGVETGITETMQQLHDLQLYPNPTSAVVTISGTGVADAELLVDVINVAGTTVLSTNIHTTSDKEFQLSLQTEALPQGIYTARIKQADSMQTLQFVIIHE